jgi:putative FmdB family regulatory protein
MTYEYVCTACGHAWEAEQSISEPALKTCPNCHEQTARRQISGGAGFILKGGGWYADLYGSAPKKSGAAETKSESKSETSSSDSGSKKDGSAGDKGSSGSSDKGSSGSSGSSSSSSGTPTPSTPSGSKATSAASGA